MTAGTLIFAESPTDSPLQVGFGIGPADSLLQHSGFTGGGRFLHRTVSAIVNHESTEKVIHAAEHARPHSANPLYSPRPLHGRAERERGRSVSIANISTFGASPADSPKKATSASASSTPVQLARKVQESHKQVMAAHMRLQDALNTVSHTRKSSVDFASIAREFDRPVVAPLSNGGIAATSSISETIRVLNEQATAKYFETIKSEGTLGRDQELLDFLTSVPKAALHGHIDGEVDLETLLNFAAESGLYLNPHTLRFTTGEEEVTKMIPAHELELSCNEGVMKKLMAAMTMNGCDPASKQGHEHFFEACKVLESITTHMPLSRKVCALLHEAEHENIFYREIMEGFAGVTKENPLPTNFTFSNPKELNSLSLQFQSRSITVEQFQKSLTPIFENALKCLRESGWLDRHVKIYKEKLDQCDKEISSKLPNNRVVHRFTIEVMRDLEDQRFFVEIAAAMQLVQEDPRHFVGINRDGPEHSRFAMTHNSIQLQMINFLFRAFASNVNISLHTNETSAKLAGSITALRDVIPETIRYGHPKRLGHVQAIGYGNMDVILKLLLEQGIAIEGCLSSNRHILGVEPRNNPLGLFLRNRIPVTIETDDKTVNGTTMGLEYKQAVLAFNLSYLELKNVIRTGFHYSFLPGDSIYTRNESGILEIPARFCGIHNLSLLSEGARREIAGSQKAQMEQRLEELLVAFEARIASRYNSTPAVLPPIQLLRRLHPPTH